MNKYKILSLSLGILIIAFSSVAIKYLNIIFTPNFRWLIASILFLITFLFCGLFNKINKREFFLFYILNFWIFFTIIWSEEIKISLYKSIAYFIVCTSCLLSSYHLSFKNKIKDSLNFMLPIFFLALFAGFGGIFDKSLVNLNQTGLSFVYSGITLNTNYLGALTLVGLIIGCLNILRSQKFSHRLVYWIFTLSLIFILFSTFSRTAIISLLLSSPFLFLAIFKSFSKTIFYSFGIFFTTLFLVLSLNLQTLFIERFILKTEADQSDFLTAKILTSRTETLNQSFEAAKKGGIFGLGFGVSYGAEFKGLSNNLSLVGYSREKTNSILASIEEIGLIGTSLYAMFIVSVIRKLLNALDIADKNQTRFLFITFAGIIALLVISLAEAFLLSPGSMQLPLLYSFLGAAMGSSRKIIQTKILKLKK